MTGRARSRRRAEVREAFAFLHEADPVLAMLIDKRPDYDPDAWLAELPTMDLFGALVFQVIGQQISVKAARAIFDRLASQFGGRVPNANELIDTMDREALRRVGMSNRKADTILELASRFADGSLSERRIRRWPDDRIISELTQIKGIGAWTVQGALMISLRRGDVVPTGDLVLRTAVRKYYGLDHLPSEAEVTQIAEAWRPYASLGANLLFASVELDAASRP